MGVWLALAGCAVLGLGTTPVDADSSRESVSIASSAAQQRYTLSMTYTAESSHQSVRQSCGWGQPVSPSTEPIWVCSLDENGAHDLWSYAARSVRPFTMTRSGNVFGFTTSMRGTSQRVGDATAWSSWWLGGIGQSVITSADGHSASGSVTGKVSLSGTNPARLTTDMTPDQRGTQTQVTCTADGCSPSTQPFVGGFTDRSWLKRVDLRKVFGRSFTVVDRRTTSSPGGTTTETWRFRFTAQKDPSTTERWQIEVRGQDRWSWGMYTGLRGGIDVDWAHRTTLVIKDGELVSATGKVQVVRVRPFSEPVGAFDVSFTTTTPAAYTVKKAIKRGKRVELGLWAPKGSEYRYTIGIRAAGPALLEQLRVIGVADPQATYNAVVARGTITDGATALVPSKPRVVVQLRPAAFNHETDEFNTQLPCLPSGATEQDCYLTRGGQRVTVTRLK